MGRLSTHVLDTARGVPAAGIAVRLHRLDAAGNEQLVAERVTNADGKTEPPLIANTRLVPGRYRMTFEAGDYFRRSGIALPDPPFVDLVHLHFGIAEPDGHYHVPLLVSPWSYSTYRGS